MVSGDGQRRLDGTPIPAIVAVCGATAFRRTSVSLLTFVTCKPAQTDAASHETITRTHCPDDHTVTRAWQNAWRPPSRLHIFYCSHTLRPFSTALLRQSFASQHSVLLFGMRTVTKLQQGKHVSAFSSIPRFGKRKCCLSSSQVEPVALMMHASNHCVHVRAACVTSVLACHKQQCYYLS